MVNYGDSLYQEVVRYYSYNHSFIALKNDNTRTGQSRTISPAVKYVEGTHYSV